DEGRLPIVAAGCAAAALLVAATANARPSAPRRWPTGLAVPAIAGGAAWASMAALSARHVADLDGTRRAISPGVWWLYAATFVGLTALDVAVARRRHPVVGWLAPAG